MEIGSLAQRLADPQQAKNLGRFAPFMTDNLWTCRNDPRFCYYAYMPQSILDADRDVEFRTVVIIHGSTRIVEDARCDYREFAEKNKMVIVAPLFPCGMFDPFDINGYKMIREGSLHYDEIVLAMLDELHERFPNISVDRFFLGGHSGGGQFVQRFFYLHPDRLEAASISAPGRPTYLDDTVDFFWGTRDFAQAMGQPIDLDALRQIPVQLMVGQMDTQFLSDSPYGKNRVERMASLAKNYQEKGIKAQLVILPGIGHFDGDSDRSVQHMAFFQQVIDGKTGPGEEIENG